MNVYNMRHMTGNSPKRIVNFLAVKLATIWRQINAQRILHVDAFPYAVNGILIGPFILAIEFPIYFRYS